MAGYEEFGNKPSISGGTKLNPTTAINNPFQGVQDELELRDGDGWLDGVTSGLAVTTNGTSSLTVASGRGYGTGKRYGGAESLTITGYPAGTYSLYYNSADDVTTLAATTASLTAGQLKLAAFSWDGAGTASTSIVVTDAEKRKGILREKFVAHFPGQIVTTSRFVFPLIEDLWIERVDSILGANNGTAGSVTFDVALGADGSEGTTIFTTTARRPGHAALEASYTMDSSGEPDGDRNPDAGEHLTVKPVQVFSTGTASNATVIVWARPR